MSDQKETTIGQGQTLFRQGEKGGELYFIKSGTVELTVRNEETGETAVVATLGERNVLGTMSFLENEPRSATAKALTEVKSVVINQAQRERLLKTVPAWFQVLVKDLSGSLRRLNAEYTHMKAENDLLTKRVEKLKAQVKELSGAADEE